MTANSIASKENNKKDRGLPLNRAIITGGTGMLGRSLAKRLAEKNCKVFVLVRPNSKRTINIPKHDNIQIIPCDISELGKLASSPAKCKSYFKNTPVDAFFHFGWGGTFGTSRNDCKSQAQNITYTLDAVELAAATGCNVFVGAGSQAEYGRFEGALKPNTPTFPENGYGIAKLASGNLSRIACEQHKIRHVWPRILSIYGPYDGLQTMICSVIQNLLEGKRPQTTPAEQLWDYLYVDDAIRALELLARRGKDGSIYCIGSGKAQPLRTYIEAIRNEIDPNLPLGIGERPYAPKQVMHLVADIEQLCQDTGFTPNVPFDEGIRRTIDWIKSIKNPPTQN